MSDFVSISVTDAEQLLQLGTIRLKSWKGDYLHRPDSAQGVTTWYAGIGNEWQVCRAPGGRIMLRSWKGDYLHRPDSPQGVTTWNAGVGNEWTLEGSGSKVRLRSWKGDLLHRPDAPQGVTTWSNGDWSVEARSATLVAGDLRNTMAIASDSDYSFAAGSTFTQRFQAALSSVPVELAVRMGSNQSTYRARVVISVNDTVRFSHDFFGLTQRQSDWATVFPILGFAGTVHAGDWVSVSITPDRDTGIAGLKINDPTCPPAPLQGYGAITARFFLRGATAAQAGTYPPEGLDPKVIRSTMGSGGANWAIGAGGTFTQTFRAVGSGAPRELGVVMGNNQNPFNCKVTVAIRGAQVFEQVFTGLVQRQSDWAVVFPLNGVTTSANPGDEVSFSVTPANQVGFSAIAFNEVGISKSNLAGYGSCRAQFYMKS
jgi:hypothetical protein